MDDVQTIPGEGMKMDGVSSVSYFIMNTLHRYTFPEPSSIRIFPHCIASPPSFVQSRVLFREFVVAN